MSPITVLALECLNLYLCAETLTCIMLPSTVIIESLRLIKSFITYITLELTIHFLLLLQFLTDPPFASVVFAHVPVQVLLLDERARAILAIDSFFGISICSELFRSSLMIFGADASFVHSWLVLPGANASSVRLGLFLTCANARFVHLADLVILHRFSRQISDRN